MKRKLRARGKIRIQKTKPKGGLVKIFQWRQTPKGKWRFMCVAIGNEAFAVMVKRLLK